MKKQSIVILGSTGSIGKSTLDVVERFRDRFHLIGIAAGRDIAALQEQARQFHPEYIAVGDRDQAFALTHKIKGTKVFAGIDGVCELARLKNVDVVVVAITGSAALLPVLAAIKAGKKIALANKECLVMAGHVVTRALEKNPRAQLVPIDSEQNAIFQCLQGYERSMVNALYLTASGGPFLDYSLQQLRRVQPKDALAHPRWKMGKKITVDSATMMNKGLEVIEARWLFNIPIEKIKVVIHRQAVMHSLVEFVDGSLLGQLGVTDMRLPIQYALSFPERWQANGALKLDLFRLALLSFAKPDTQKFPCLSLAYRAGSGSNLLPCVLNAANERAVQAFLEKRIGFSHIPTIVEKALKKFDYLKSSFSLDDILGIDGESRRFASEVIERL